MTMMMVVVMISAAVQICAKRKAGKTESTDIFTLWLILSRLVPVGSWCPCLQKMIPFHENNFTCSAKDATISSDASWTSTKRTRRIWTNDSVNLVADASLHTSVPCALDAGRGVGYIRRLLSDRVGRSEARDLCAALMLAFV